MVKRVLIIGSALAAALGAVGSGALHAAASNPTHLVQHFTFPDTVCGFSGTTQFAIVDNFGSLPGGATYDAGTLVQTFTADNGRGVIIKYDAGHIDNAAPVFNPDGTVTKVSTYTGLNALTQAVNGPVLERGSGVIQVTLTFDSNGKLLSVSVVVLAGPNPNLTGAPDCTVIAPYLAGG